MSARKRLPSLAEATLAARARLYGAQDCETDIIAIHSVKLLYLAIPKVANSSFKRVLAQMITDAPLSPRSGNSTVFGDPAVRKWLRRKRILICKHQLKRYESYKKLAFVRNPWDRLVSCFVQKVDHRSDDPRARGSTAALARAGLYAPEMSFGDFARAVCRIPDQESDRHFRSQSAFLLDRDQKLIPDEIRKFEEIQEGFLYLKSLLGNKELELPHLKKTERRDYRDYYDRETIELVGRRYARDIDLFQYEF